MYKVNIYEHVHCSLYTWPFHELILLLDNLKPIHWAEAHLFFHFSLSSLILPSLTFPHSLYMCFHTRLGIPQYPLPPGMCESVLGIPETPWVLSPLFRCSGVVLPVQLWCQAHIVLHLHLKRWHLWLEGKEKRGVRGAWRARVQHSDSIRQWEARESSMTLLCPSLCEWTESIKVIHYSRLPTRMQLICKLCHWYICWFWEANNSQ